jgi:hypothetical protein
MHPAREGIAGALLTPSSLAVIVSTFPERERGPAIGTWTRRGTIAGALVRAELEGRLVLADLFEQALVAVQRPLGLNAARPMSGARCAGPRTAARPGRGVLGAGGARRGGGRRGGGRQDGAAGVRCRSRYRGVGSSGLRASSLRWSSRSRGCIGCARRCSTGWTGCQAAARCAASRVRVAWRRRPGSVPGGAGRSEPAGRRGRVSAACVPGRPRPRYFSSGWTAQALNHRRWLTVVMNAR